MNLVETKLHYRPSDRLLWAT